MRVISGRRKKENACFGICVPIWASFRLIWTVYDPLPLHKPLYLPAVAYLLYKCVPRSIVYSFVDLLKSEAVVPTVSLGQPTETRWS